MTTNANENGAVKLADDGAAWRVKAPELARWALNLLVNRTDVWGGYRALNRRGEVLASGQRLGKSYTSPVRKQDRFEGLLGLTLLTKHFAGRQVQDVIGLHAIGRDGMCRWVLWDIDLHDDKDDAAANLTAAIYFYDKLVSLGFTPLLTTSDDKGGYHLRCFFSQPIPAADAYHFGRWVLADRDAPKLNKPPESFPKQPAVCEGKFGNWARLPGRHHTHDVWAKVYNGTSWLDGTWAVDHVLALVGDDPALIPAEAKVAPPAKVKPERPPQRTTAADLNSKGNLGVDVIGPFNRATPIKPLLSRHGYVEVGDRMKWPGAGEASEAGVQFMTRGSGVEAAFSWSPNDKLYADELHSHDAFSCFRILEHGGNVGKAVRAAAQMLGIEKPKGEQPFGSAIQQEEASRLARERANFLARDEPKAEPTPDLEPVGGTVVKDVAIHSVAVAIVPEFELRPRDVQRDGDTRATVEVRVADAMVFVGKVVADSEPSRRTYARNAAPKIAGPDPDATVLAAVTAELDRRLSRLVEMEVPEAAGDSDLADAIARHAESQEKRRKARADTAHQYVLLPGQHEADDGHHEVGTDQFADEVIGRFPPDSIYRRGQFVGQLEGERGHKAFKSLSVDGIRMVSDRATKMARWIVQGKGAEAEPVRVFQSCSKDCGGLILAAAGADPRVPQINTLTSYPVFGPGFALTPAGYHQGTYYDQSPALVDIVPERDAETILCVLDDFAIDYPFKDEASRQNYYGLLLTPMIRPAIAGNIPMHGIFAPLERTGKTKLVEQGLGAVYLGREVPAQQLPERDEEADKRVMSMLKRGDTLLHLDNLREFVDSPVLASLLTSTVYQGRDLGRLDAIDLPNNLVVVGTGNNVRLTGEMAKRIVPINLQPKTDSPETRTDFVHPDFFAYASENRALVLSCLAGMVETWKANGRPKGAMPMGGFDQWATAVGGILKLFGFDQWMTNAADWRASSDPLRGDLRALVQRWYEIHGIAAATSTELMFIAISMELFGSVLSDKKDKAQQTAFGMSVMAKYLETPVSIVIGGDAVNVCIRKASQSRPTKYSLHFLDELEAT
jgi:hypothetical protein